MALPFTLIDIESALIVSLGLTLVMLCAAGLVLGRYAGGCVGWKVALIMTSVDVALTTEIIAPES